MSEPQHALPVGEPQFEKPTHPFPILQRWLSATWWDPKAMPKRTVVQYGLYWRSTDPHEEFRAIEPMNRSVIEPSLVLDTAWRRGLHESCIELLCVHLDNGDEFYIRVEEGYGFDGNLDEGWATWVQICRGAETPLAG